MYTPCRIQPCVLHRLDITAPVDLGVKHHVTYLLTCILHICQAPKRLMRYTRLQPDCSVADVVYTFTTRLFCCTRGIHIYNQVVLLQTWYTRLQPGCPVADAVYTFTTRLSCCRRGIHVYNQVVLLLMRYTRLQPGCSVADAVYTFTTRLSCCRRGIHVYNQVVRPVADAVNTFATRLSNC